MEIGLFLLCGPVPVHVPGGVGGPLIYWHWERDKKKNISLKKNDATAKVTHDNTNEV